MEFDFFLASQKRQLSAGCTKPIHSLVSRMSASLQVDIEYCASSVCHTSHCNLCIRSECGSPLRLLLNYHVWCLIASLDLVSWSNVLKMICRLKSFAFTECQVLKSEQKFQFSYCVMINNMVYKSLVSHRYTNSEQLNSTLKWCI